VQRRVIIHTGDLGGADLASRLADWDDRVVSVSPAPGGGRVRYRLDDELLGLEGLPGVPGVLETPLRLAGRHNAANAACVAAAAAALGLDGEEIATGLASFGGVGRRFEIKGEPAGVLIIDDYGHHPTAIRATIAAVRDRHPGRRLWVAHEPLTYHRAAAMLDELAAALATADEVVIADIWAGRDTDTSVTSAAELAAKVTAMSGRQVAASGSPEATAEYLAEHVRPGDIVLAMGGGRSYVIAEHLLTLLEQRGPG
jgi:UDP-N-acetylmuramate--alanine ligase